MHASIFHKVIAAVCFTSTLTFFSYSLPKQVLAQNSDEMREGLPGRRIGGATRGGAENPIVALVPENNQGLTVSGTPTFFFYVSKTQKPQMAEFVLVDENGQQIYQTTFTTNGNSGVVEIGLPTTGATKSLEIGKAYRWYFAIIPNATNRREDVYVTGGIKRVQPNQELDGQLKNADPLERVTVYAANNLWYDAIATLAELRRSRPVDAALTAKWSQLLQSINLDKIAQEPLVNAQVSAQ